MNSQGSSDSGEDLESATNLRRPPVPLSTGIRQYVPTLAGIADSALRCLEQATESLRTGTVESGCALSEVSL